MNEKTYKLRLDKTYHVVAANPLWKAKQKLTARESKLLYVAISQIIKEAKDLKTYTTTVTELAPFLDISAKSLYRDLPSICDNIMSRVLTIPSDEGWIKYHWVDRATYNEKEARLTLRLSDDIKPFLLSLTGHYCQLVLGTLLSLRSYYAIRLYQEIKADYGESSNTQEVWSYTIPQLRELFGIKDNQYKLPRDLIRKTLQPALKEINELDDILIENYKENKACKKGNPLESVSFEVCFFRDKAAKDFYIEIGKKKLMMLNQLPGQLSLDDDNN